MFPKLRYIRSEPLVIAFRAIPCQNCGRDDGTVCCAHSNWAIHGHGRSIKASDQYGASLCAACHVPLLDQGSTLGRCEKQNLWWRAHVKSVLELLKRSLWPKKVPVPDIETWPFETEEAYAI